MGPECENPAVRADGGASQDVVAWWRDTSDNSTIRVQCNVLAARYGLTRPVARVVAEAAFAAGGPS